MKTTVSLLLFLMTATIQARLFANDNAEAEKQGRRRKRLALADDGKYGESWDASAEYLEKRHHQGRLR